MKLKTRWSCFKHEVAMGCHDSLVAGLLVVCSISSVVSVIYLVESCK